MIPLRNTPTSQIPLEALMRSRVRGGITQRKYSINLLEEAVRVAREVGPTNACRITNVSLTAFKRYVQAKRVAEGGPAVIRQDLSRAKYSMAQKRACARLALKFIAGRGTAAHPRSCWRAAGKQMGINGETIQKAYERGLFVLD